jgi:hypothetical protein
METTCQYHGNLEPMQRLKVTRFTGVRVLWDVRYDVTIYIVTSYLQIVCGRRHALVEYYQISISQFAVNLFPFVYLFLFPRYPTGLLWIRQYGHNFTDDCTKNTNK